MELKTIPINQINPASYNPRKQLKPGDKEFEKLRRSLEEFGCVEPLILNSRTGNLVGGHQRLSVLKTLGRSKVEVVMVDLTLEREKTLNIALNKIDGEWDEPLLAELLTEISELPDFDLELTGFDTDEAADLLSRILDESLSDGNEDFDLESELDTSGPAITQLGDLIELGDHRLLCGDCTDKEQVARLMNGERAILFATDPPYLINYDGLNHPGKSLASERKKNKNWKKSYGITWDDADANPDLYENFVRVAVDEAIHLKAAWYCWHASRRQAMVESVWNKFGAFVHQQIIWVKDRPILNRSWYTWQHEPCFFGWVKPNKPHRVANNYPSTTWEFPTIAAGKKTEHPTSKPLDLFRIPIQQHTRRGEICYEPFCGSGSQLIAAEQLDRRCFALEISPQYCDVIVRRWIRFIGESNAPCELVERYRKSDQLEKAS